MKTEDWQKINDIVVEALELDDEVERRNFIEKQCRHFPTIQREVESLVGVEGSAEDFFESPAVFNYAELIVDENESERSSEIVGKEIGHYKVIREIGHGGMGVVYLAERNDGLFDQRVALKLLKSDLNSEDFRRRFLHERQILASLEHPNIARLLDAGTSSDGVPFIAMEYIEGIPIDVFCEMQEFNVSQRLTLFQTVCQAVAYAHRNLVVHRDLKPSNILVTKDGIPKLLDFGIAKLLSSEFEDQNAQTVTKLGAMTPSYASPEQIKGESVSTSTDIYSLGVILYELLSGRRPFKEIEQNFQKISKAICETEPPPPSFAAELMTKAEGTSTSPDEHKDKPELIYEDSSESIGGKNKTTPQPAYHTSPHLKSLNSKSLKGDLDNIVLKSLKKEPERRYPTVESFSEDIRRHLEGLPVFARPDTFSYRAEKFIKRHRAGVLAASVMLLLIIAGIIATLWQSRIAAAERDRARLEAQKAKKINEYTQNILNFSNPHWMSSNPKRNRDAKISDALDEALKNIETDLKDEPEIQAEILFTLGQTYVSQVQYEKAEKLLRQSIEKFDQIYGDENVKSMQAYVILGDALYVTGKFEEAEQFYTKAINYFRPKVAEDKSQIKWLAIALNDLGNIYAAKGKYAEYEAMDTESLELSRQLTGKERFMIPIVLGNLGRSNLLKGDFQGSLSFFQQALEEVRALGNEQQLEGGNVYSNIGQAYSSLKDYKNAEENYQKGYEILVNAVGEDNIYTLQNRQLLAENSYSQEKYSEARAIIEKTLQIEHKVYPNGHFTIGFSQRILGKIYTKQGELKKGETEIHEALENLSKTYKEPSPEIAAAKMALGENLIAQSRFAEAKEALTAALDSYVKTKGEEHPFTKRCRELLNTIPQNTDK